MVDVEVKNEEPCPCKGSDSIALRKTGELNSNENCDIQAGEVPRRGVHLM